MVDINADKPATMRHLARALGVDPALVTRYAQRGMPTDSIAAARAWRARNVRPNVSTATRAVQAADAEEAVQTVNRLMRVAVAALEVGRLDLVETELRRALRKVPAEARSRVLMAPAVMDALCAPVFAAVARSQAELDAGAADPEEDGVDAAAALQLPSGAGFMPAFVYAAAANKTVATGG